MSCSTTKALRLLLVVLIAAVGVAAVLGVQHFGVDIGMFTDVLVTAVQPESSVLVDARPATERATLVTPAPAALCSAWECDCQTLSNLLHIAHSQKTWGGAADTPLAKQWWLDQRCRTDPTAAVPSSSARVADALDALAHWAMAKLRRGGDPPPTPIALPSPERAAREWAPPAWIKRRAFSASVAPLWSAAEAAHVMVVAGDFCISAEHCEATTGAIAEEWHAELRQGRLRVWVALTAMLRSLLAGAFLVCHHTPTYQCSLT